MRLLQTSDVNPHFAGGTVVVEALILSFIFIKKCNYVRKNSKNEFSLEEYQ